MKEISYIGFQKCFPSVEFAFLPPAYKVPCTVQGAVLFGCTPLLGVPCPVQGVSRKDQGPETRDTPPERTGTRDQLYPCVNGHTCTKTFSSQDSDIPPGQ